MDDFYLVNRWVCAPSLYPCTSVTTHMLIRLLFSFYSNSQNIVWLQSIETIEIVSIYLEMSRLYCAGLSTSICVSNSHHQISAVFDWQSRLLMEIWFGFQVSYLWWVGYLLKISECKTAVLLYKRPKNIIPYYQISGFGYCT